MSPVNSILSPKGRGRMKSLSRGTHSLTGRVFPRGPQQEKNKAGVARTRAEKRVGERWRAEWEAVPGESRLPDQPRGPPERWEMQRDGFSRLSSCPCTRALRVGPQPDRSSEALAGQLKHFPLPWKCLSICGSITVPRGSSPGPAQAGVEDSL